MKRVWIEFEKPASNEDAQQTVAAANAMMAKLGIEHPVFGWDSEKRVFLRMLPENAGFVYLSDNGEWFNLDFLASITDEA